MRASSSGRSSSPKANTCGRGAGAVKATGFYEGPSSVEGTSGRHAASPFTRRCSRRPWRLPLPEKRKLKDREGGPTFRRRGRGDRGVRGTIPELGPWEENAHARSAPRDSAGRGNRGKGKAQPTRIRRSVRGCRETPRSLIVRTEPQSPSGSTRCKPWRSQELARYGCTQIELGGRSRSDASRVLFAERSQGLAGTQGASRREARSTA